MTILARVFFLVIAAALASGCLSTITKKEWVKKTGAICIKSSADIDAMEATAKAGSRGQNKLLIAQDAIVATLPIFEAAIQEIEDLGFPSNEPVAKKYVADLKTYAKYGNQLAVVRDRDNYAELQPKMLKLGIAIDKESIALGLPKDCQIN